MSEETVAAAALISRPGAARREEGILGRSGWQRIARAGWRSVARGPGRTGEMIIALPETTARYVRISSGTSSGSWWSLAELSLRHADLTTGTGPLGWDLIRDSGSLSDGSRVLPGDG